MIVYIVLLLVISLLVYFSIKLEEKYIIKNKCFSITLNNLLLFVGGIIFVFLASTRKISLESNPDLYTYCQHFKKANKYSYLVYVRNSLFEVGFASFLWIMRKITNSFHIVLMILYSIIYFSHIYFIKKNKWNKNNFIILTGIIISFFPSLYLLRIYLSVSIGLVCFVFISKKKYMYSLICIVLAILTHNASIILIPVIIYNVVYDKILKKNKYRYFIIFVALCTACMFILSFGISLFMENNSKYYVYENEGSIPVGIVACMMFIIIYSKNKVTHLINEDAMNKTLLITVMVVMLIIPLQMQYGIMYRMSMFFIPVQGVLLMKLYSIYDKKLFLHYIIRLFAVVYSIYRIAMFFMAEIKNIGEIFEFYFK